MCGVDEPAPSPETLESRQRAQEQVAREALSDAGSEADAHKHARRAEKARYLREKLAEQKQADRDAES